MSGPYFITTLDADIRVHPSQMNNNIMDNIKSNLQRKYSGKCYNNYGYIDKIYDVYDDIKDGVIRGEDSTSSSVHRVKFNCRVCNPMKESVVVGQIVGVNNMIMIAVNGPIKFIINGTNINTDNVQFKKSAFYPVTSKGELINKPIVVGSHVNIKIMSKKIVNGKDKIFVYGRLESIITDDKLAKLSIENQYKKSEKINAEDLTRERVVKEEDIADIVGEDNNAEEIEEDN
jgi:DNA-directed RNA polymerase subunit E'/Rpb7